MNLNYLPKEWYIAQTKWLSDELEQLSLCFIGMHKNRTVVRMFTDKSKKHYKEYSPNSKHFDKASEIATRRAVFKKAISNNKNILRQHYKIEYESIKDSYIIVPNNTGFLDSIYWSNSCNNPNQHQIKTKYYSNGINYKSRFEKDFASECTNFGLDFKYEPRVFINEYKERYADFGFYFPMFNRCAFVELLGQLTNENYIFDTKRKLSEYVDYKFYIGRDLFILSGDDIYMPGQQQMKALIHAMITTMCELHIKKLV